MTITKTTLSFFISLLCFCFLASIISCDIRIRRLKEHSQPLNLDKDLPPPTPIIHDNTNEHKKLNLSEFLPSTSRPNEPINIIDTNEESKQNSVPPSPWSSPTIEPNNTVPVFSKEEQIPPSDSMFWFYLFGTAVLVCGAGIFSGLTLGVLSLDHTTLLVLSQSGPPDQREYAKVVLPIVKQHHHVLVTLLISNAAAAETMPIFLEQIVPASAAIAICVLLLLFFGEIIPQSICTRWGLMIGAKLSWFMKLLMFITYPLSKPIAMFLDWLLGDNHITYYRRAELINLIGMHGEAGHDNAEPLSNDEVAIIKGALEMTSKTIKDAMVPLKSVFMLSEDDLYDQTTLERISRKGHSRIPIYREKRTNIVGLVLVKNLLNFNVADKVPLSSIASKENLPRLSATTPMYDALNEFQTGRGHLAVIEENQIPVGIITLEDLIEELLQEEIEDEKDRNRKMKVGLMAILSRGSSMSASMDDGSFEGSIPMRNLRTTSRQSQENENQPLIRQ